MRTTLLVLLLLVPSTAQAERVFRASIDAEQNDRLDALEAKLSSIENSLNVLTATTTKAAVEAPKAKQMVVRPPSYSVGDDLITSSGAVHIVTKVTQSDGQYHYYHKPKPSPVARQSTLSNQNTTYVGRWSNYDGMSREDHARVHHGLDPSTMSASQLAMQMDADHDRYGPGHSQIQAMRRSPGPVPQQSYQPACPNGVCPTSQPVRRGFFGWRR